MKVLWAQEALNDRTAIWDYLAERNPRAAADLDDLFSEAAERLAEHPLMGVPGKIAGTRELVPHEHYRLVYEVDEEAGIIRVVTLIHTARCWPPVSPDSPQG